MVLLGWVWYFWGGCGTSGVGVVLLGWVWYFWGGCGASGVGVVLLGCVGVVGIVWYTHHTFGVLIRRLKFNNF